MIVLAAAVALVVGFAFGVAVTMGTAYDEGWRDGSAGRTHPDLEP